MVKKIKKMSDFGSEGEQDYEEAPEIKQNDDSDIEAKLSEDVTKNSKCFKTKTKNRKKTIQHKKTFSHTKNIFSTKTQSQNLFSLIS